MKDGETTARERNFLDGDSMARGGNVLHQWEPPDRGHYVEAINEATEELESIGAMIRYLLGKSGACRVSCFLELTV